MRLAATLLALPALAAAADQVPLKDKASASGWFNKAKEYVESAVPVAANPIDAGAAKVAEKRVHKFTHANYDQKLTPTSQNPADGPEEWLILVTGGNKTCYGRCDQVDRAWNVSVPLLSVLPNAPNFGIIDCERQSLLCTTWATGVPSLWLFQVPIPAPDQSQPRTPLYIKALNTTTTTTEDIVRFFKGEEYATTVTDEKTGAVKEKYRYDGPFHPINGQLKIFGLLGPIGYLMWGFSQIPSFVFMILISFVSRNIMSRRATTNANNRDAQMAAGNAPAAVGAKKSN